MDRIVVEDVRERSAELVEKLAGVWEASVRATHHFLTEADVVALRPEVYEVLESVAQLAVVREGGAPAAFAGAEGGVLEMLFAAPAARGCGVGKALLAHAVEDWGVHRLDVNEQNPAALGFYEHEGFFVAARSSADGAGRPFPTLHLALATGIRAQMASGEWFEAADLLLEQDRIRARRIMQRFNADATLDDEGRAALLGGLLGALGAGSSMSAGAQVDYGYHVYVGCNCFFNFNCTFLDGAPIVFGDDVWVGPNCTFATALHPMVGRERAVWFDAQDAPHLRERNLPIVVGNDVWIAAGVTVNPGVTIGDGAVIGSGSVVTKDVPPRTLAFGNPCRPVREITAEDAIGNAGVVEAAADAAHAEAEAGAAL